jgi:hypothetical protein
MKWLLLLTVFTGNQPLPYSTSLVSAGPTIEFSSLDACREQAGVHIRALTGNGGPVVSNAECIPYDPKAISRFRFELPGQWEGN